MDEQFNRVYAAALLGVLVLALLAVPVSAESQVDGYSRAERAEKAIVAELQKTASGRIRTKSAVITKVDFDGPRIMVDGRTFEFSPAASINLLAGSGAPTLLRSGMAIRLFYESPDAQRKVGVIHRVDEVERDTLMVF